MSVNLYSNLGTTYSGIVTGAELTRVSEEIFGGASLKVNENNATQNIQPTETKQTTQAELGVYDRKVDLAVTQQIAQANADYNVQISLKALQNIEALNTFAATRQTNIDKINDGRIYIPVDNTKRSDVETPSALMHTTNILKPVIGSNEGQNPFSAK